MKVEFTFKHLNSSDALMEFATGRIEKVDKFALKPLDVHFAFETNKHECIVVVTVLEGRRKFQAQAVTTDFYKGIDNVVNKLMRQMSKDKRRIKDHRNAEPSHYGKIARLTPELEIDYTKQPLRKVG